MKTLRCMLVVLGLSVSIFAQSLDLGNSIFYNGEGDINLLVDARVAVQNMDSPYVMFVLYMSTDDNVSDKVKREDVVLIHGDKEYNMPSVSELRENYRGDIKDYNFYSRLPLDVVALSEMRFFQFDFSLDFFPVRSSGRIPVDQGYMSGRFGFKSTVYFKNPGFKKGDLIGIKVKDEKDPEIWGGVGIQL